MGTLIRKYKLIDNILEVSIYIYVILIFLTIGEGIRNILLFTNFFLWLLTLKNRENIKILTEPISLLFWGFIATILISVIFSIDPLYSFTSLREDPLKSVLLFPVLSTVLSEEKRFKRLTYVLFGVLIFTISIGFYSYWAYDLPIVKPNTPLRHANLNRFALDLNILFPFAFILFLTAKKPQIKIATIITVIAGISALILSTSRGGSIAFFSLILIWAVYGAKKYNADFKKILIGIIASFILLGTIFYNSSPYLKLKITALNKDIKTLSTRTTIWTPLVYAVSERPITGWGYGPNIFKIDLPFQNTPFKTSPSKIDPSLRQPHNAFLRVLFHQGIVGLFMYLALLIGAIKAFWKNALERKNFSSYILFACTSILISSYLVHSIVENTHLLYLSMILGIGVAARNLRDEDSNSYPQNEGYVNVTERAEQ